ncbi:MAG TPA: response regulator transcription factor [Burkholderiales bacterium]|nr:response regulator transcription factor [Burkholderiales bacterium]
MTIRVLIADDHAVMRQGLRALLGNARDVEVVGEAATGREALEIAGRLEPDVIVMDISMPQLNGLDATSTVCAKLPATRVVILSMHADVEYAFRAFAAGASAYLLKESAVSEIMTAIRAAHAGRRFIGPGIALEGTLDEALAKRKSPLERLSIRERQVLQLVVEGYSSATIAERVHLSPKTVESYRSRLMKKIGVKDLPALVKFAIEHGLTPAR